MCAGKGVIRVKDSGVYLHHSPGRGSGRPSEDPQGFYGLKHLPGKAKTVVSGSLGWLGGDCRQPVQESLSTLPA